MLTRVWVGYPYSTYCHEASLSMTICTYNRSFWASCRLWSMHNTCHRNKIVEPATTSPAQTTPTPSSGIYLRFTFPYKSSSEDNISGAPRSYIFQGVILNNLAYHLNHESTEVPPKQSSKVLRRRGLRRWGKDWHHCRITRMWITVGFHN